MEHSTQHQRPRASMSRICASYGKPALKVELFDPKLTNSIEMGLIKGLPRPKPRPEVSTSQNRGPPCKPKKAIIRVQGLGIPGPLNVEPDTSWWLVGKKGIESLYDPYILYSPYLEAVSGPFGLNGVNPSFSASLDGRMWLGLGLGSSQN